MFCTYCGIKLNEGAKYCEKCGAKVVIFQTPEKGSSTGQTPMTMQSPTPMPEPMKTSIVSHPHKFEQPQLVKKQKPMALLLRKSLLYHAW